MKSFNSFSSFAVLLHDRRLGNWAICLLVTVVNFFGCLSPILSQENAESSLVIQDESSGPASQKSGEVTAEDASLVDFFSREVATILNDHCVACHGTKKNEGGYRLDSYQALMEPGDSEELPVKIGDPSASLLVQRITETDVSLRMPPEDEPLTKVQIEKIQRWIESGAKPGNSDPVQPLFALIPPANYPPPSTAYPPIPVIAVAFSPDQQQVICAGHHELTVWDIASQTLVRRISNLGEKTFAIALHPEGKLLAVACGEPGRRGEVRLIDFSTGNLLGVVARSNDTIWDVAFRPGRDEIAVASADLTVKLIQFQSKELLKTFSSHADWVTALAFSSDGNLLATASRDRTAKVFDLDAGQMLVNFTGHTSPVRGVAFTPDGTQVLSVGDDKNVRRWNVSDGKQTATVLLDGIGFRLNVTDGFAYVPSAVGAVYKLDLTTNRLAFNYIGSKDCCLSSAVAKEGRVVSGYHGGSVSVWNPDGTMVANWTAAPN